MTADRHRRAGSCEALSLSGQGDKQMKPYAPPRDKRRPGSAGNRPAQLLRRAQRLAGLIGIGRNTRTTMTIQTGQLQMRRQHSLDGGGFQ